MDINYLYPGSFDPATYGHLDIALQASRVLPRLVIVCSENPEKSASRYPPAQKKKIWRSYDLPANIDVITFEDAVSRNFVPENIILVRGIRGKIDLPEENKVMLYNKKRHGITKYLYFFSKPEFETCSSSLVRKYADELAVERLSNFVSAKAISYLLEKALGLKKIFMVVGKPGSGKSTILHALADLDGSCHFINTDEFAEILAPRIELFFPGRNIVDLALNEEKALGEAIGPAWIGLLKTALRRVPRNCYAFVEIPYGLMENKRMYRFIGGRILYIGCSDDRINFERNIARDTPQYIPFIEKIPGKKETQDIARKNRLDLICVDTSGTISESKRKAIELLDIIRRNDDG